MHWRKQTRCAFNKRGLLNQQGSLDSITFINVIGQMRFFLFFPLMLALAAPVMAQDATSTIATVNSNQQDADIAIRIRDILTELGNYSDVTVTVNEGIVTLRGTANSVVEASELAPLASRIQGVVAVKNQVTETADIATRLDPAMDRFRARVTQLVAFLPLALISLAVFALIVVAGVALSRMKEPWDRLAPNAFIAELYRQFVRIAFVVIGLVIALDIINATALLSTILGAAGIIGLALGFAVRDTVENYIASVMLSIRQPFRPNDVVEINGDQGKVIRLTSRATILLSFDGNHIRIPNATVFKSRIINFSKNTERRFSFDVIVERDADLQSARDIVEATIQNLPFVIATPAAQAWIEAIEPLGVKIVAIGWIDQHETSMALAKGEAIRQAKLALAQAGIALAVGPQPVSVVTESMSRSSKKRLEVPSIETTNVAPVRTNQEDALKDMIDAERAGPDTEDLLDEAALKE